MSLAYRAAFETPSARASKHSSPSEPEHRPGEEPELTELPAAVVEIPRFDELEEYTHESAVVVIIPWERSFRSFWWRLWHTAKLATERGPTFFNRLPEGDLTSALAFALTAEIIAISGLCLVLTPAAWLAEPSWLTLVQADAGARITFLRGILVSIPSLAVALTLWHAVYGFVLDLAARQAGARPRPVSALRFSLYATGWYLVLAPLGLIALCLSDGPKAAKVALRGAHLLPRRSAISFLCGIYGLNQLDSQRAHQRAQLSALLFLGVVSLGCALLALL